MYESNALAALIGALIFYILIGFVTILITALIMRWIFRINTIITNQEYGNKLLEYNGQLLKEQNELLKKQINENILPSSETKTK